MSVRVFGCNKFRRLVSEQADRDLSAKEIQFLQKHRGVCPSCTEVEQQSDFALNLLRNFSADNIEINPAFEDRVIRRIRVSNARDSFRYWAPALAGGVIAGIAIFGVLQVAVEAVRLPQYNSPGQQARRLGESDENVLNTPKSLPEGISSKKSKDREPLLLGPEDNH